MGFFSWKTQDSNRSIANCWSRRKTFVVYMLDDKGNVYTEYSYGGYGEFGGKDYYELLAEMNGYTDRDEGIAIEFGDLIPKEPIKFPNLVRNLKKWKYDSSKRPKMCDYQGFFY